MLEAQVVQVKYREIIICICGLTKRSVCADDIGKRVRLEGLRFDQIKVGTKLRVTIGYGIHPVYGFGMQITGIRPFMQKSG